IHHSLAWKMLHNAIIGPETVDHPYFVAFMKGFRLPCGPLDLNLFEFAKRFSDGTCEFVTSLLETRITGKYESLRIDYVRKLNNTTEQAIQDALASIFPAMSDKGFPALFWEFLEGSGLPPPLTVQGLQGRFSEVVSLQDVSKKGYRMKMFCWATTGVPRVLLDGYTEVRDSNDS
ncbi:hypothetical protein FB446DRAFT_654937, partial [Lentinula raphanica]